MREEEEEEEKIQLYQNLKQEIRSLLISSPKSKYGGITGGLLYFDYKQLNSGKEIPYAQLGFHSVLALLRSMPDVVRIEFKENGSCYRVHPVFDQTTAHIQKMVWEQRDKYRHQNKLFDQQWRQKKSMPIQCLVRNSDRHFFRFDEEHSSNSRGRIRPDLESYFLLTPSSDEKRRITNETNFPSNINDHNRSSSTLNTYLDTPPHFDFDDYQFSMGMYKDIPTNNDFDPIVESQLNDSLLVQSTTNEQQNVPIDFDEDQFQDEIDDKWLERMNNAIRHCIEFRYIHRLYQLNFHYRHYPKSDQIISIKSQCEKFALDEYEQELEDFEKESQSNSVIDDHKCRRMFDQYIALQRNYYFMKKIMNKNQTKKIQ